MEFHSRTTAVETAVVSVWFERPTDPSQWHWFATQSHGVNRGRGLVTGDVIRHDGLQVATIAQEVLVRRRRDA